MIENWHGDSDTVGEMADLMRMLSDPTRIRVLGLLQPGEMNVTALCGELGLAQPTVSHHLGLLRTSSLVTTRRDGKQIFYSLNAEYLSNEDEGAGLFLHYGPVKMQLGCNGDCEVAANAQAAASN